MTWRTSLAKTTQTSNQPGQKYLKISDQAIALSLSVG
jgi:hypothetical protein